QAGPAVTIAGRYELGPAIAVGGMGAVYLARDRSLDRKVAVKVLREEFIGTDLAARFHVEAQIMGQLQHPAIPPVHDLGTLPDGRPFLVMKLIEGATLATLLKERETSDGDLERFLPIFEQICLAVAFAHARGVIHRDLKPANVMVGAFGEVQVMDWGLAKRLHEPPQCPDPGMANLVKPGNDQETLPGTVLGTVAFMPPEQ